MRIKLSAKLLAGDKTECTAEELQQQHLEHRLSSRGRLQMSADDVSRMVAEFAASRGGITRCPPAYVAKSPQYNV
jgi:hypothetical protein